MMGLVDRLQSSGEAEFVLVTAHDEIYVGVGSDHTDREVETYSVTVSKQMCDKPISSTFWPFSEVNEHWDDLLLRSYVTIDEERVLYQEGSVSGMLSANDLLQGYLGDAGARSGIVLFGGTSPAIGGIRPAQKFEAEIEDPVLERKISFGYEILTLPILG